MKKMMNKSKVQSTNKMPFVCPCCMDIFDVIFTRDVIESLYNRVIKQNKSDYSFTSAMLKDDNKSLIIIMTNRESKKLSSKPDYILDGSKTTKRSR